MTAMAIKDRITALRRVRAGDLVPNPKNWRQHPQAQRDALCGILSEVGYVDALLARELPDGRLMLIDGHLRAEMTPDEEVPVLVVDLDEAEADKVLLTFDPLAAMAEASSDQLAALLVECKVDDESVNDMIAQFAGSVDGFAETKLKQLLIERLPPLSWVLIGIPTVRFGEINERIEQLAAVPGIVLETTVTD